MEYTIEITQFCENNCNYCSTNATAEGKHLPLDDIRGFLKSNNIRATDRINVSGGEPLAHPNFWDILQLCKKLTPDVWIYTNALHKIRYNTSIIKEIQVEANVCLTPGDEVFIPQSADKVHLLQLIPQGRAKHMKSINMSLSGYDCDNCNHKVLQADGKIVQAPCKKQYK